MLDLPQPDRDANAEATAGSAQLDGNPNPGANLRGSLAGLKADVIVIGAGVTGLTAALVLKRAGRRVVVLDAGSVRVGETCHTTAHLTEVLDTRFATLLARLGAETTKLAIEGQRRAIAHIEGWVRELGVRCGFERLPGYLYAAPGNRAQQQALDSEAKALLDLGYGDRLTQHTPAPFAVAGALRFKDQAQLRPLPYLAALESQINGDGSLVLRDVRARAIEDEGAHKPCQVATTLGDVLLADHVIVATHVPLGDDVAVYGKLAAYRSYVIAAPVHQPLGALLWDLADPYHHARTARVGQRDFLIVGGGDHPVGDAVDTEQVVRDLVDFARGQFGPLEVTHRWSGQIIETADGLPYVGQEAQGKRVLFATGLSGNGFTNGTLAGLVLADAIQGRENQWSRMLAPDRALSLSSLSRRVGRNLVAAKHRLGRRFRGDARRLEDLPVNAAMVTRRNRHRVAVYRDAAGTMFAVSAMCPQRGGEVRWNALEKSWDCPTCGSRFDITGGVLNGPASVGLPPRHLDDARSPVAAGPTPPPLPSPPLETLTLPDAVPSPTSTSTSPGPATESAAAGA